MMARCARSAGNLSVQRVLTHPAQVAIRSLIAVSAAASLAVAPVPAMAADVFTYGRPAKIAEKEQLLEV